MEKVKIIMTADDYENYQNAQYELNRLSSNPTADVNQIKLLKIQMFNILKTYVIICADY
jgi:hypothetical protein